MELFLNTRIPNPDTRITKPASDRNFIVRCFYTTGLRRNESRNRLAEFEVFHDPIYNVFYRSGERHGAYNPVRALDGVLRNVEKHFLAIERNSGSTGGDGGDPRNRTRCRIERKERAPLKDGTPTIQYVQNAQLHCCNDGLDRAGRRERYRLDGDCQGCRLDELSATDGLECTLGEHNGLCSNTIGCSWDNGYGYDLKQSGNGRHTKDVADGVGDEVGAFVFLDFFRIHPPPACTPREEKERAVSEDVSRNTDLESFLLAFGGMNIE